MSKISIYLGSLFILITAIHSQDRIDILSPEPNTLFKLGQEEVLIAVSLFNVENSVPENVKLYIDEKDVTAFAVVEKEYISYLIIKPNAGIHRIQLQVSEDISEEWSFEVPAPSTSAVLASVFDFKGNVSVGNNFDQIDEETLNVNQFKFNLNANVWNFIKFSSNIKLTSEDTELVQPRNVYKLSLSIGKYLDIKIGDSNPTLSKFTMNGKRLRGLSGHLKLGPISVQYADGEINRTIQGSLVADKAYSFFVENGSAGQDSLLLRRNNFTFQQRAWMGRLQLGTGRYFKFGINALHARDKIQSVSGRLDNALITWDGSSSAFNLDSGKVYTVADLLQVDNVSIDERKNWSGADPKDNLVVALDLGISGFRKRFYMEGEAAFSLMNNNIINGARSKAEMDTLLDSNVDNNIAGSLSLDLIPFEPTEVTDIFIVNENMLPLSPIDPAAIENKGDLSALVDGILSMPSLALNGKMGINAYGNSLQADFTQVGPEFNSFGNPYLVKNSREFGISDKLKLLSNRLTLGLMYKHQDDKILTTVIKPKDQNTIRLTANVYPGVSLPNVGFDIKTIERTNNISIFDTLSVDTLSGSVILSDNREHTQTFNWSLNISHSFILMEIPNTITLNYLSLDKEDQIADRNIVENFVSPDLQSTVLNLTVASKFAFGLKTNIGLSTNSSTFSIGPDRRDYQDFLSINGNGDYLLKKFNSTVSFGFNYAQGSGFSEVNWLGLRGGIKSLLFNTVNLNLSLEYRLKEANNSDSSILISKASLSYIF